MSELAKRLIEATKEALQEKGLELDGHDGLYVDEVSIDGNLGMAVQITVVAVLRELADALGAAPITASARMTRGYSAAGLTRIAEEVEAGGDA